MADSKSNPTAGDRIRWKGDEEAARSSRQGLQRSASNGSLSIHFIHSRRNSLDPAAELPIQYRTMSIEIEDGKQRDAPSKNTNNASTELAKLEWHVISVDEVVQRISTSLRYGLSGEQVKRRIEQYGKNCLTPPKRHRTRKILGYFFKGFGTILLAASILVFVAWKPLGQPPAVANLALAIVLLAVFFIQAAFNMWQDWSSSRVMASIKTMLPDACLVLRDGDRVNIQADQIVRGDVLLITAGNKLPADVRFVEVSSDAKFDRSILTGESFPLSATTTSTDVNYLETRCIGLQGTHCVSGVCTGVVVATGDDTVFGRIAELTNEPKTGLTTLGKEVLNFVWIICSIMFTMIVVVLIVWAAWLRTTYPNWINVPNLIISCVSVAVAFIPEGLPVALTASMTISAQMMRKNKVLCKSLKTVETLGSVTVICSDKTGTLTQNKMVVTECAVGTQKMTADGAKESLGTTSSSRAISQLRAVAGLCNAGQFDMATMDRPLHERIVHGDATDQAILRFSEHLGPVAELRRWWLTKYHLAFNSKNKYMIQAFGLANPEGLAIALPEDTMAIFEYADILLTIKGAPEVLMDRISSYVSPTGVTLDFDIATRAGVEAIKDEWSSQGRRVLLLARKAISGTSIRADPSTTAFESAMNQQAKSGLTLVGLVGLVDPPRPEIPQVVSVLRGAGIRIFMVTGDFALTAQAIAVECGIISQPPSNVDTIAALSRDPPTGVAANTKTKHPLDLEEEDVVTSIVLSGPELITLNETQWDQLAQYDEIVFARTTPEQKLRIVREFQARGQIVGMTGDGVNDAPSLRAADIGIALGSGSDIAIEAADMVLLDSFSSIVEALRYGRMMFDNLKKTVAYLLPAGSFSEFWPVLTNVVFGMPQILSSFMMIVICLFTDAMAAIALAYEPPEADVLLRKPRAMGKDRLVDWKLILQAYGFIGLLETTLSFAMSYWYLQRNEMPFTHIWFSFGNLDEATQQDYLAKLNVASSIYFVNLVVMQWFNLLCVRTRRLSIFQHPPLFNRQTQNLYLFPAILFGLVMAFFWCYVPKFQETLGTAQVPVEYWFLPMAFGCGIVLLEEARKYAVRHWPGGFFARIAW